MAQARRKIAVIGGANVDIGGFPYATLVAQDSNPGQVNISAGGVGRNIAENAARLGLNVELITAIGNDSNGKMLLEDCSSKQIGTRYSLINESCRTSVYLFIVDTKGDMHCAVNDMEIQSRLTPESMLDRMDFLNEMQAVVIDANLPEETLGCIARNVRAPIFADPVSLAKATKLRGILPTIDCLKPNRMEAEVLSGMQIRDFMDAAEAARRLVNAGVKRIFLTMGEQGALCADAGHCVFLPGINSGIVNTTGAGDAFMAALLWAHCEGLDLKESGIAGMAAAQIAMSTMETVNPGMSRINLKRKMADISARM